MLIAGIAYVATLGLLLLGIYEVAHPPGSATTTRPR